LAARLARSSVFIIAADGGANICRKLGLKPNVIIGDLDSLKVSTRHFFSSSTIIQITRQDNTDLEKALDYSLARKIRRITIIAATGKRLDFTLGNLSVFWNYTSRKALQFVGDGWLAQPVGRSFIAKAALGTIVSLIPFGTCSGVTLRGLRYSLTNATMRIGEIGVSNVVVKSPFSVHVKKGNMLAVLSHKNILHAGNR
ncbi:MAG: thiamine diphosphokinase, partial [Ignavibacteriae bacterium]|nr:thiamine diphosphokinase [Ignavibacteriota bacterium]